MKTTTKQFKTKVQNHIIDRLGYPWDDDNDRENENATIKERLQNVIENFNNYYNDYERRRIPNRQNAFIDFLLGLPGCLSVEYFQASFFTSDSQIVRISSHRAKTLVALGVVNTPDKMLLNSEVMTLTPRFFISIMSQF